MNGRTIGYWLCIFLLAFASQPVDTNAAVTQPLRVTTARLDRDAPGSGNSGRALIKGFITTAGSGADLEAALLANTVTVSVTDGGAFAANVALLGCTRAGSQIRCINGNVRARVKRIHTTATDTQYRLWLSMRQLSSSVTGAPQPRSPVRIAFGVQNNADLVDVISDCTQLGASRLGCRDRDRPNIIFIVSDDQRADTLQYMPATIQHLANNGVSFSNAFVTTPLCAPSRATMLTGQYARHHGVLNLALPNGGALQFVGADASTLATWLHDAGYRTGMYGKYLTDYSKQCPPYTGACYIPPGWDEWHVFLLQRYYNYALAENEQITQFGNTPAEYSTDVIGAKAVDFIMTAQGQPFFLHVGFHAPHQDGGALPIPAVRHAGFFPDLLPWRPPSYDESDMSDKPPWVANQPQAATPFRGFLTYGAWGDAVRENQVRSLPAIDEAIDAIVNAVESTGQADNTVIVFTSDNGYLWGEHRSFFGKDVPFEESVRVPLIIRYPRLISSPRTETRLVLNLDLAPTLSALAGAPTPSFVDGVSLEPLLSESSGPWRSDFVLEHWSAAGELPDYAGIRSEEWKFIPYPTASESELYDLVNDPYELTNQAHNPAYADVVASMQARLDALLAE